MPKKKNQKQQSTYLPSPQEQIDTNQVGDPKDQKYIQQNLQTFQENQPHQSFDELISDKIFEIKKKLYQIKKVFPDLNFDTVKQTPEEIFDQDDLRLFKSINSMISPSVPLTLTRKLLSNDYPITQLLDDYNLSTALIEISEQFKLALQDEPFYYPFCCFYTQLWFQDAIEYAISSDKSSKEKEKIIIENVQEVFSKKFAIINQILSHNTYKLNKKDAEYLKTKAYSMELADGYDQAVLDCILFQVKQSCIDFNMNMRKNRDEIKESVDYIDLTLLESITKNHQQFLCQEKNRLSTIIKQSLQLKFRRINNNYLSNQSTLKKKSPHLHNQIKKLVEKNQFFIGKKVDQMMYQLIQEDDALIPPSQSSRKLNQIQQGIISLMNQQNDDSLSSKEKYQLIKEQNNNKLMKQTTKQEVRLFLERKILKSQMKQQGLLWQQANSSKYEKKKDIKQIILEGKLLKAKQQKKEENKKKFLEDYLKTKQEKQLDQSFVSQTTKEKTSADQGSSASKIEKPTLKNMIQKSLQEKEPIEDLIQKNDLEKFITRKINQRLKDSLEHQDQNTIEQIQQYLDEFNQNLHQLPISIIKKLIHEQQTRKQFVFNLMTRIDQLDFAKNEIYIDIIKKLKIDRQNIQTQLEQINQPLEEKYTNQVQNYLRQLQPMIQNAQNQQNFVYC